MTTTPLTAFRERLARDHMNHGCDTWDEHMRDCEALLEVAEAAAELRSDQTRKRTPDAITGVTTIDFTVQQRLTARLDNALARLTQEEGA